MSTPDLFSYVPQRQNFRRSDPVTSKEAGRSAAQFKSDHHAAILKAMAEAKRPLAAEQISDIIGILDTTQVCKRFAEMISAGLIERTPEQHTNRSNRKAFRHRLKQTGVT